MAHKGLLWPIAQQLRILAVPEFWPRFPAEKYIFTATNWQGPLHASFPDPGVCTCVLTGYTSGDRDLLYKGTLGTFAGHLVECGFTWKLVANGIDMLSSYQCWIDGAKQVQDLVNLFDFPFRFDNAVVPAGNFARFVGATWPAGGTTRSPKPW